MNACRAAGTSAPAGGTRSWSRRLARAGAALTLSVTALVTVCLLALAVLPLFGGRLMIVTSGSMGPTIEAGDAVIVVPTPPSAIVPGDVIIFRGYTSEGLALHRVVSRHLVDGRVHFRTQGDANQRADPNLAPAGGVAGRFMVRIPQAGHLLQSLARPTGRMLVLVVPALVLAGLQARELTRGRRAPRRLLVRTGARLADLDRRTDPRPGGIGAAALTISLLAMAHLSGAGVSPAGALMSSQATVAPNTVATLAVDPPAAVTAEFDCGLLSVGKGVIVDWDAAVNAESYEVARATTSGGPYSVIATVDASTTRSKDTTADNATTYYYVVRTVAGGWTSEDSTEVSVTTPGSLQCLL